MGKLGLQFKKNKTESITGLLTHLIPDPVLEIYTNCNVRWVGQEGISGRLVFCPGLSRYVLVSPGLAWSTLVYPGLSRSVPVCPAGLVIQRVLKWADQVGRLGMVWFGLSSGSGKPTGHEVGRPDG